MYLGSSKYPPAPLRQDPSGLSGQSPMLAAQEDGQLIPCPSGETANAQSKPFLINRCTVFESQDENRSQIVST
jgi:hypothetical protein